MKTISRADALTLDAIMRRVGYQTGEPPGFGPMWRAALADLGEKAGLGEIAQVADYGIPATAQASSPVAIFEGIVDLNHNNPFNAAQAKQKGVAAVIHKATEGTSFVDPLYRARKAMALSAGMLWGAYHFAAFGNGFDQAKAFLAVESGQDKSTLLALDFEPSSHGGPNMTVQQAHDFVTYVHDHVGRWPMIYGGGGLLRDLLDGKQDTILANCPLWLADYRTNPKTIAPTWPDWTLLQFREDNDVSGYDWNRFRGTEADLRAKWPLS